MGTIIKVLSERTINRIAAGEVIENPASVVKELVENGIDADATSILIEIKAGGFQLIRISDNGKGMGRDDLFLSIERHATSKIRESEDLQTIHSMGFRGEALASIAAIARMRIETFREGDSIGSFLIVEGGIVKKIDDTMRKRGTTVEVQSLFYNVPARKKFQKSPLASQAEILKMITKLSLSHPRIGFTYIANDIEVFSFAPPIEGEDEIKIKNCIEVVLGENYLKGCSLVKREENECSLLGYIGLPREARHNRSGQYLILNGRVVDCKEIAYAIYDGYGTRLENNRHPCFVLQLTLPTTWVDINVHPQKREVRLLDDRPIKEFVRKAVIKSFEKESIFSFVPPQEFLPFPPKQSWSAKEESYFQPKEEEKKLEYELPSFDLGIDFPILGQFAFYAIVEAPYLEKQITIASGSDGIFMINLHAAVERITYELLLKQIDHKRELQGLLLPITLECTPHEGAELGLLLEDFLHLGISIRPFGGNCFIIDALDPILDQRKIESLVYELIEVLSFFKDKEYIAKEREIKLALTLSRFAKSKKKGYSEVEAKNIIKELIKCQTPNQCPKGKLTIVHLSLHDIEKYFQI